MSPTWNPIPEKDDNTEMVSEQPEDQNKSILKRAMTTQEIVFMTNFLGYQMPCTIT